MGGTVIRFAPGPVPAHWSFACIVGVLMLCPEAATAQCRYEIEAIVTAPDCGQFNNGISPRAMNSRGDIAGSYVNCGFSDEAFFWSKDTGFITLPRPPGVFAAYIHGVNDSRIVCGDHWIDGVGSRGFVYDININGPFIYLQPLHGVGNSHANGINNSGIVAGARSIGTSGTTPFNAVLWRPFDNGDPYDLGVGNAPNSAAIDGSNSESSVGWSGSEWYTANARPILWIRGRVTQLHLLPDTTQGYAQSINDRQEVVGAVRDGIFTFFRGVLWRSGTVVELIPPPPFERFTPNSINNVRTYPKTSFKSRSEQLK